MSDAEIAKPEIKLSLDKERTVVFDWNAICAIEKATGRNLVRDTTILTSPDANFLRGAVYGCLLSDDPSMTVPKAGELMGKYPHMIQVIFKAVIDGITALMEVQKKSE